MPILKNRNKITNTISLLEDIYSSAWKNMRNNEEEKKLLETNLISPYGNKVIISDLISYCYLDEKEDENMFAIECETKKYKYEDFDTLEQARNEYIKVFGESREDIEEELSNNNENVVVCNELIKDIVECLNDYINENTERYWWE